MPTVTRTSARLGAAALLIGLLVHSPVFGKDHDDDVLILTSTNNPAGNAVEVFRLRPSGTPSLSLVDSLPTGGKGGAGGNAGILQFGEEFGAVANYGSNTVTRLSRAHDSIHVAGTINLAAGCTAPDSLALQGDRLYVAGAQCAESHAWPSGQLRGGVVNLPDASAGQIVVGRSWAAVTLKSGSVQRLPLSNNGALTGASTSVTLPALANDTPLGADFWGDVLGFTPAHSPNSFALVDAAAMVYPIAGPAPAFPANAPCWVAKGPGSIWYTANSPGHAISVFLTDAMGGVFYKSIPLAGGPTDITVSSDQRWLAVIFSNAGNAYVQVFAIDAYGDLKPVATSDPIGVAAFNGVAISN